MSSYADMVQSPSDRIGPVGHRHGTMLEAQRHQGEAIADMIVAIGRIVANSVRWARRSATDWLNYRRAYAELAALDSRMLSDIGITAGDIEQIARGRWVDDRRLQASIVQAPAGKPANLNLSNRAA